MNIFSLLVFEAFAAFGLAYIIGHSKISLPFRMLVDPGNKITKPTEAFWSFFLILIECPACLGFWIGSIIAAIFIYGPDPMISREIVNSAYAKPLFIVSNGLFVCGVNFVLGRATGLILLHDNFEGARPAIPVAEAVNPMNSGEES